MKRASLISAVLTVALAIACSTPTNNTNKNGGGGGGMGPGTANPGLITIAVVVTQDPAQQLPTVEVTDPSYASTTAQKIRWCVYNNSKSMLSRVSITFNAGTPCDNNPTLTVSNIDAGNDPAVCTDVCGCVPTAGSFSYSVNVTTASGGNVQNPNPRVILN